MRLPAPVALTAVVGLAAASLASAATLTPRALRLNWVEQASTTYYPVAMTFKVKDVTVTAKAWSIHASVANRSAKPVRIVKPFFPYPPQYSFGLGWAPACEPPAISCPLDKLAYTYAKPPLPTTLRRGQTWSGVFGGPGRPPHGKLIYVTFGYFQVRGTKGFTWITMHAFKL